MRGFATICLYSMAMINVPICVLCCVSGIFASGNVRQSLEKWLGVKEGKGDREQGGSERTKANLWLAVRPKALNYTVQASQE